MLFPLPFELIYSCVSRFADFRLRQLLQWLYIIWFSFEFCFLGRRFRVILYFFAYFFLFFNNSVPFPSITFCLIPIWFSCFSPCFTAFLFVLHFLLKFAASHFLFWLSPFVPHVLYFVFCFFLFINYFWLYSVSRSRRFPCLLISLEANIALPVLCCYLHLLT